MTGMTAKTQKKSNLKISKFCDFFFKKFLKILSVCCHFRRLLPNLLSFYRNFLPIFGDLLSSKNRVAVTPHRTTVIFTESAVIHRNFSPKQLVGGRDAVITIIFFLKKLNKIVEVVVGESQKPVVTAPHSVPRDSNLYGSLPTTTCEGKN